MKNDSSEITNSEIVIYALRGAVISIILIFPILFYWIFPLKKLSSAKRKMFLVYTVIYAFIILNPSILKSEDYYTDEIKFQPAAEGNSAYTTAKKLMQDVYTNGALVQQSYENKEISVDGVIKNIDIEENCRQMDCNNAGIAVQLHAIPFYNVDQNIAMGLLTAFFDINDDVIIHDFYAGDQVVVKCNEISVAAPALVSLAKCHSIKKLR